MLGRTHSYLAWAIASTAFLSAIATFVLSLNQPVAADLAMLHYSAWLINEKSFVLYQDIFEINFPAPFLLHSLLGQGIGYEALPLRFADFALLLLLGIVSWKILSPLSRPAALLAPSLFALLHMIHGAEFSLERDSLALLPAAAAFLCAISTSLSTRKKILLTACFSAAACSIKPNAVVMVPVVLYCLWLDDRYTGTTEKIQAAGIFILCTALVSLLPFIWVYQQGGFDSFIRIYETFFPIYSNSRYDLFHYQDTAERLSNLLVNYTIYGGSAILLALPGLLWAWSNQRDAIHRQRTRQLAAITLAFTFYEAIAGKFWLNHLFPSAYWVFLCVALLLVTPTPGTDPDEKLQRRTNLAFFLFIPIAIIVGMVATPSFVEMKSAHDRTANQPGEWRAQQIADFLISQALKPDDTVQILDMAGDGQAALLMAKATSSTRHLIDVPLYMQPDSPETQALRREFIADIHAKNPRFIVYVDQFLHPGGGNRLKEFRELSDIVEQYYDVAELHDGSYTIYRRNQAFGNVTPR
jgi:hypothetical protein